LLLNEQLDSNGMHVLVFVISGCTLLAYLIANQSLKRSESCPQSPATLTR
jgi:hypothetical protein